MITYNRYNLNNLNAISNVLPKIARKSISVNLDEIHIEDEDYYSVAEVLEFKLDGISPYP
jgi:hypothetical protein